MQSKGFSLADGGHTLLVPYEEGVGIQIAETEEGIQAEPMQWVCSHFVGNGVLDRAVIHKVVPIGYTCKS